MAINRPGKRVNSLINSIAGNAARGNTSRRSGRVTSVGKNTCDVLFDGDTKPTPGVKFTGSAPRAGTRLEVRDLAGRNEAITPSRGNGSRAAGLVINNNVVGSGGGSSLTYPLPHASSHAVGGGDPLTPAAIGAAVLSDITSALSTHTSGTDPHSQYLLASGTRAMAGTLSTQHILPALPDTYDLGSQTLMFRRGYISEMDTFIQKQSAQVIHQGMDMIVKDSGALTFPIAAADTTYDFGKTMTPNDFILFRGLGAVEYMQIGAVVTGTEYNITRNLDGSGANDWPSGAVYAVLGYSGDGRIVMDASTGVPSLSMILQGTTYNSVTTPLVIDSSGIAVESPTSQLDVGAYKFTNSGSVIAGAYGYSNAGNNTLYVGTNIIAGHDSIVRLTSGAPSGGSSTVEIKSIVSGSSSIPTLTLTEGPGVAGISLSNVPVTIDQGLNLGTATGAGTGEIKTSGPIVMAYNSPTVFKAGSYVRLGSLYSSSSAVLGYNAEPYSGTTSKMVVVNTSAAIGYGFIQVDYSVGIAFHTLAGSVTAGNDATSERMRIKPTGVINIAALTSYANNAAAVSGGLAVGDLYRLGDTVGVVHA